MKLIQTQCWVQKPVEGYYRDCFAILGVEYQTLLLIIFTSLIAGFGGYFIFSSIKGIKFKTKNFVLKSIILSVIVFIILLILRSLWQSRIIY